jgi:Tol biopolymer transport system component
MNKGTPFLVILCLIAALVIVDFLAGHSAAQPPSPPVDVFTVRLLTDDLTPILPLSLSTCPDDLDPDKPAASSSITGMADWSRMAFQSYRDGNWEIYVAQGDGSGPVRLTAEPSSDLRPRLNRGADHLAFYSYRDGNYEIYTMRTDGLGLARLTVNGTGDASPAWSPDGDRIAFASQRDGNWEIYVMNADGSSQVRLTSDAADDVTPAWSPDGSQIAWVKWGDAGNAIWLMNADGTNPHALTLPLRFLENPVWSPDGTRLAFDYDADGDYWNELASVNANGNGLRSIYDPYSDLVDPRMGSWSPDGNWLLFSRVEYVVYQNQLYLYSTYVERVPAEGGTASRLTTSRYDMAPDWQTADIASPYSRVAKLPQYSRVDNLIVEWDGADVGLSGITGYDVQYRIGTTGVWTDWQTETTAASAAFSGTPGATVYFRSRARDEAGNVETWPDDNDGDTFTTLYTWKITGSVRDIRGRSIPGASVTASPVPIFPLVSQLDGNYYGYLTADNVQTLSVTRLGYGAPPAMTVDLTADVTTIHALPPSDDLVLDGGFEAGVLTDNWQVSGDPSPALSDGVRHTGNRAVVLGRPFSVTTPVVASQGLDPRIAIDSDRTVHLVGILNQDDTFKVLYASKSVTGTWPATPTTILTLSASPGILSIVPDQEGGIHVVWTQPGPWSTYSNVFYCHKLATASVCTAPEKVTDDSAFLRNPQLASDPQGGLHLVWHTSGLTVEYAYRPPGGDWQTPETVAESAMNPDVAADDSGYVHVVWGKIHSGETSSDVWYSSRRSDTDWITPVLLGNTGQFPYCIITAADDGTIHVGWTDPAQGVFYTYKTPRKTWAPSTRLIESATGSSGMISLAVDGSGTVHTVIEGEGGSTIYMAKGIDDSWHSLASWNESELYTFDAGVDRAGVMHAILQALFDSPQIYHLQATQAPVAIDYGVSQVITMPVEVHRATISLLYYAKASLPGSSLQVIIGDEYSVTRVPLNEDSATQWRQAWADLSYWSGQRVTLTVLLHQEANSPFFQKHVDEIILGSWLTPIISDVSPPQIEAWTPTPITITGDNFVAIPPGSLYIEGPTLRLDSFNVPDMRWINSTTLTATVPALPPGVYDVWVANPSGQEGTLAGGLVVGRQLYLPVLFRGHVP